MEGCGDTRGAIHILALAYLKRNRYFVHSNARMDWGMIREYLISDPKILAPGFRQREMSNEQIFF